MSASSDAASSQLAAVLTDLRPLVGARLHPDAELVLPAPPGPCLVAVGHEELVGVLVNLVGNALDALPAGRGRVEVALRRGDGAIELEVRDDGVGIAPEHLPRLFDFFFTTKPPGKGTGLGLSLVDRVVRNAGGVVRVASEPGRGACFTVVLPTATEGGPT